MDDTTFQNLAQEQLFEGFTLCRKNAQSHICAELIASQKEYGLATAHLILGVEEGIKAILLLAKHLGIDPELKSIKPYFKKHEVKHETGKEVDQAYKVIIPIVKIILAFFNKDIGSILTNVINLWRDKDYSKWWESANNQKNKGLYVGLEENKWISPQQFTKENYSVGLSAIQNIREFLELTNNLKPDDYKQLT